MSAVLEAILEEAREQVLDPDLEIVRRWKDAVRGRTVVGSHTPYFPTEMAEALGMLHVSHPATEAPIDLLFAPDTHPTRAHRLRLPSDPEAAGAVHAWEKELRRLVLLLEAASGRKLAPIYLRAAIHAIAHHRTLMRQLLTIRSRQPHLLRLSEAMALLRFGALMPRRQHVPILERAIAHLEIRRLPSESRLRVALVSLGTEAPPLAVLEEIDHSDLYVVDDDLGLGDRIDATPRPDGGAFTVLAETYIEGARLLPPPFNPHRDRVQSLLQRLRVSGAAAVLIVLPASGRSAWAERERIEAELDDLAIPHLLLPWGEKVEIAAPADEALADHVR